MLQAWQKADAEAGWTGSTPDGSVAFDQEAEGLADTVPAFGLARWNAGRFGKCPAPDVPFGLELCFLPVTDAGPEGTGQIQNPAIAKPCSAKVTDAGLKNLAGLKSLQSLDLFLNQVTDAGLKELAGFKSPPIPGPSNNTQVTDAGLKELAGLKCLQSLYLAEPR